MKIKEVIAENFAYDYAEPYGIFEPEDFLATIKELATDNLNFHESFLLAVSGLEDEWPELHDQVCEILKPYALRFLLKVAGGDRPHGFSNHEEYFDHWIKLIRDELKPKWPELDHIEAVAHKAFTHNKPESVR